MGEAAKTREGDFTKCLRQEPLPSGR
jgi:hypothetical protein